MTLTVECGVCGKETKVNLGEAVKSVVDAAERGTIFGGFICGDCADETGE